jgi:hypothetical protein
MAFNRRILSGTIDVSLTLERRALPPMAAISPALTKLCANAAGNFLGNRAAHDR